MVRVHSQSSGAAAEPEQHIPRPPVADRLRAARRAARLSQVQLAARADLALQTIGLAERMGYVTRRTAERVAAVLGCDVEDLLPERQGEGGRP